MDCVAGKSIGVKTIAVLSGKSTYEDMREWPAKPDLIFNNLLEASEWIIKKEERKHDRKRERERG